ncbi:MAG TPA: hypothetical protein VLH85_00450 [Levilinea sp.]|nr:hypothetical protein [Levilinea sp.]
MKFTHQEIQEFIQRSLQEPLLPQELAIVSQHLAECADCAVYRYELSILEHRLPRTLAAEYPERRVGRAEMAQILHRHRQRTQHWLAFDRFFMLVKQAAFATAGVALVAALAILIAQFGLRRPQLPLAQHEPAPPAAAPFESLALPAASPATDAGETYNSVQFSIQIQVPLEWQLVQQDSQAEVLSGDDGFVKLATLPIPADSLEQACAAEAESRPDLYGDSPQINQVMVAEFQACLITGDPHPVDPQGETVMASSANALVVEDTRRDPEERYWIMAADAANFETLASSLQILPVEEEITAARPSPQPAATPETLPPTLTLTTVEVEPESRLRLAGERTHIADSECIKSELHIGALLPEWWPSHRCATLLPDGTWEIVVPLGELNPPAHIDPTQQNRFKVYLPGVPSVFQWAYYPHAWAGLTLEEHAVVEAELDSPLLSGIEFKKHIPEAVLEKHAGLREISQEQSLDDLNQVLEPFGYQIEAGTQVHRLLRNGELLSEGITHFFPISVNAAGSNFTLVFEGPRGVYLLQKDGLVDWNMTRSLYTRPVYVGGDLITVGQGDDNWLYLNVLRNGEIIFTKTLAFTSEVPVRSLQSFNGQWVLETNDALIIDGVDIGQQLGYDEVFHWQPLNDRPFYFFLKDGKIGLSYDNQVLPVQYDLVIHGQCCEPAIFNPAGNDAMVWFYALRESVWYYVELGALY